MWLKWIPWRLVVSRVALAKGFLDPLVLLSHIRRFGQPSEIHEPWELLRAGALFHARGLVNSRAIQHNLDWVWPYWVERQFDPEDPAFIPRSFSITHINLTHRNWTAVGIPGCPELPIVDPRGLVTPFFDGWSIDAWIVTKDGHDLVPSRTLSAEQRLDLAEPITVVTGCSVNGLTLDTRVQVTPETYRCRMETTARSDRAGWLVLALRPYNPEGISFIRTVKHLPDSSWEVNGKHLIHFDPIPERTIFSHYREGDVMHFLNKMNGPVSVHCDVGMATGAALFELQPGQTRLVSAEVPLTKAEPSPSRPKRSRSARTGRSLAAKQIGTTPGVAPPVQSRPSWRLNVPDPHFQFLYDAAIKSVSLHSWEEIYPGPYTYKRFWFRDAAFIISALLALGMNDTAEAALDRFAERQTPFGYFLSQEGEWDSNGEALWIMNRFCQMACRKPKESWRNMIERAARWIQTKRVGKNINALHRGLLPAGFSAEHLGLNDFYYWDDFWGVAGLISAAEMMDQFGETAKAEEFRSNGRDLMECVERTLRDIETQTSMSAMPASPYRRFDAGAIGSLAVGYPLQLWPAGDPRLVQTADMLIRKHFLNGGFFQDMIHSGINPYLTLHVAQILLRENDQRFFDLMKSVAALASPTGQWPEAVHPRTGGGCMGDGQHVWASAEWILMLRNCFLREESNGRLVIASGFVPSWRKNAETLSLGPAPTLYGNIEINFQPEPDGVRVSWTGHWPGKKPTVEFRLPGCEPETSVAETGTVVVRRLE